MTDPLTGVEQQSAFPWQAGYVAPQPDDPRTPSKVTAPAPRVDGTPVQRAHEVMSHAQRAFADHIVATQQQRHRYSDSGYAEQVSMFSDSPAGRAVDKALPEVEARRDQAEAKVEQLRAGLTRQGDVADELRATRAWDRARRILDAADQGSAPDVARDLLTKAGPDEIGVLATELAPYLQSRGQSADWLDTALGQVVPEYGAARTELDRAEQALQITTYNHGQLRKGFREGRPPTVICDGRRYDPDAGGAP